MEDAAEALTASPSLSPSLSAALPFLMAISIMPLLPV
jgi:hypothetical protein